MATTGNVNSKLHENEKIANYTDTIKGKGATATEGLKVVNGAVNGSGRFHGRPASPPRASTSRAARDNNIENGAVKLPYQARNDLTKPNPFVEIAKLSADSSDGMEMVEVIRGGPGNTARHGGGRALRFGQAGKWNGVNRQFKVVFLGERDVEKSKRPACLQRGEMKQG